MVGAFSPLLSPWLLSLASAISCIRFISFSGPSHFLRERIPLTTSNRETEYTGRETTRLPRTLVYYRVRVSAPESCLSLAFR